MGFDVHRFSGDVDEELVCPICSGVLEDPLQVYRSQLILLSVLVNLIDLKSLNYLKH